MVKAFFFEFGDFECNFILRKRLSFDFVVQTETAIGTDVLAFVAQIHRSIHLDGFSETLFGQHMTLLRHFFQKRFCGRGNQNQKVVQISFGFGQSGSDFRFRSLVYFMLNGVPVVIFKNRFKIRHVYSYKKAVKGLDATALLTVCASCAS